MVDGHFVGLLGISVVFLNLVVVFHEDGESVRFFTDIVVFKAVRSLEILELIGDLVFILLRSSIDQEDGSSTDQNKT